MNRFSARVRSVVVAALLPLALVGCKEEDDGLVFIPTADAGTDAGVPDAGSDAGPNAGGDGSGPVPDAGLACGTPGAGLTGPSAPARTTAVRIVAANITSGNAQSYDPGEGIRILQGIRPDVAMLQELNYGDNSDAAVRTFVTTAFGAEFQFYREPRVASGDIPNGVVSRWPILEAGEWDDPRVTNRDFVWARIDLPGPRDLWAVSLHLLTADAPTRNAEGVALVDFVRARVRPGDYLALAGDLNTDTRSAGVETVFTTLEGTVCTTGNFPVDQNGDGDTNATRAKPYDHVLADGDLHHYQTATVIGSRSFANGTVIDTRVFTPLSDIAPAQVNDSGATNMQHMAVVKDFRVPAP